MYVTHSGYKDGDNIPHIHVSDDYGQNWNTIASDLPDLGINNIEVLPQSSDSVIFVATDGGVYFTKNSGNNWERAGNNMPIILVFDIEIDLPSNRLVAGTFSRSIQSISLDSLLDFAVGIEEIEAAIQFSVYPNPASEFIRIKSSSRSNDIDWQIVNIYGQVIKRGYGINNTIDISDLSPGSYVFVPEQGQKTKFLKIK